MTIRGKVKAVKIDPYLLLLIGAVALGGVLPVHDQSAVVFGGVVYAAITLLFFLYGARISPRAVRDGLLHWRLQSLVFLSTYVLFPLLGLLMVYAAQGHIAPALLKGILFLCVLPSTVQSSIAFTSIARGNVAAALTSASVSNLLGVVLTPLLVALLVDPQGNGFSLHSLQNIGLQILLPFALGQLARPHLQGWLSSHPRLTSTVDRGSILLVVYAAFSEGTVSGAWSRISLGDLAWVSLLSCLLLAVMMALVQMASQALGFSREDRIATLFCGSKKSMASGIPMAGILFSGPTAPLIILPLMVFHQVQLFVCAFMAQAYAKDQP
ncbi:hypothetical protein ABS71_05910 [bacterium SCN 62-11]|nr:bile acid:sodium symporter [Candidatus Eremiobacteraeota bacterium]ODT74202.1 MAG: hypothetical protein ABS71_05910 [bacterium SCN 62-11]